MSGLALHLAAEGNEVYGSNFEENERVEYLRRIGMRIYIGHARENWENPDVVVHTTAVSRGNPELERSISEGVPILYRMELLRKVIASRNSLCVTGTDGKTTTTAMLSKVMIDAGRDPVVFLGGKSPHLEHGNYRNGEGPIVAEVDESDGFFASFSPLHAIITNVRGDHLEHYNNSLKNLHAHFSYFARRITGIFIYNADDEASNKLFDGMGITFGEKNGDYRFTGRICNRTKQSFEVYHGKHSLGHFTLNLPGIHNVYNATSVIAMAAELGIPMDIVKNSLAAFKSVDRRFTFRGFSEEKNLYFIDDYAHTPDEITNTIRGAKESYPDRKIIVVFQPHRYSRLARENGRFAASLKSADAVCVYKLYDAYEKGRYAVSEVEVLEGLKSYGVESYHADDYNDILNWLNNKRDAVVLFLGAGDITEASKLSALKFG